MSLSSHYNEQTAKSFLKLKDTPNLTYLIYRDMPGLLKKHLNQGRALDFGCGPGISTRFLSGLGFEVIGVDINREMVKAAFTIPDGIPFAWIEHGKLPFPDNCFDLVTSIMVLLEMPNLSCMKEAINEISRVLKPGGIFLAVVGSEYFPKGEWINKSSISDIDKPLSSGDIFVTSSNVTGINFIDYFYTDDDYRFIFEALGLKIIEHHEALGHDQDGIQWHLEKQLNPFTHYVCKKIKPYNATL
jgi:SAM-dependent methyltransferase